MSERPFQLIGELINHSFARARRAWENKDVAAYKHLARLQTEHQAKYLTVNIDGTQTLRIRPEEMLAFLPDLVPALQEATTVPLAFDNPAVEYHRVALGLYDRARSGKPILNSLAASRPDLDEMISLVKEYDTKVIVMASEKFTDGGSAQCTTADDVYHSTKEFVHRVREQADRTNDDIIIDPGLAPVSADTYGLVNMGLDAMRLIRQDPDLEGVHLSVGLTNFSFGVPKEIREGLENAFITLALANGLDFVLGNPEKDLRTLEPDDPHLQVVTAALEEGRPQNGESQEDAGFRQAAKIMDLFSADRL